MLFALLIDVSVSLKIVMCTYFHLFHYIYKRKTIIQAQTGLFKERKVWSIGTAQW